MARPHSATGMRIRTHFVFPTPPFREGGVFFEIGNVSLPILTKITTQFQAVEDRLCLCGLDQHGQTHMIWLTRRFANEMVKLLFRSIDDPAAAAAPLASSIAKTTRQLDAKARLIPTPEVTLPDPATSWLAVTLQLQTRPGQVRLVFSSQDDRKAQVDIGLVHLHQWLSIIYANYLRAGWLGDFWPDWFADAELPAPPPTASVH